MSKKNKLLIGINNEIYNDFVNVCRKEETTIVDKLEKMMSVEIKKS